MEVFKVLQFGKYYPPAIGGMEKVIFSLTEGINEAGIVCDVLCSNTQNIEAIDTTRGYTVYRAKSYGVLFSMSIAPGLIKLLWRMRKRYDIIHFHHPDPMSALALFITRPKAKIVIHWHLDIVKQKIAYVFYRPLEMWLLKRADKIIATSPNYLQQSKPLGPFRGKCTVIPLGIRPLPPVNEDRIKALREKYPGRHIIFSLGRFTSYKGFEYLILSAEFLSEDFQIVIGGDGPLKSKMEKMIDDRQLARKVKLIGKMAEEDVLAYFAACDVFCLPSVTKNEAFGLVILEAMNYGKPIIATTIKGSGTSWVNQHGLTGVNVPPFDASALAIAIKDLAVQPKAEIMGLNAKMRFESTFTNDRMMKSVLELYAHI